MSLVAAELIDLLNTFMWPFIRVSAAFLVAPIFSMGAINLRTRILMGFIITMMISLPFKLLLFVLVDGWGLVTGSLVSTFLG